MGTRLRPAVPEDAAAVCTVVRRSIAECCMADHHNDPALLAIWLKNKTVPNTLTWLEDPGACSVVAEVSGSIVGFGMSRDDEILLCYLVPEARFKGIGKAMLQFLETHASEAGASSLRLQSTRSALAFYMRNAFKPSGPPMLAFGLEGQPMAKNLPALTLKG